MEHITSYDSDSGTRDLGSEETYNKDMSLFEVLQKAIELKAHMIVKTSYVSDVRPGAWYIKGYKNTLSYEEIKATIEDNVLHNKFPKRICYLIKYL